jgi:hypothetical protein
MIRITYTFTYIHTYIYTYGGTKVHKTYTIRDIRMRSSVLMSVNNKMSL